MKKIIISAVFLIITISIGYCLYIKSDKKKLENFANEITNESINTDIIIDKYIKCSIKGRKLSLYTLNIIRQEYKKNKDEISIYSAQEAKKYRQDKIVLKDNEKLYYIRFNKEVIWPFIINDKSEIIIVLILSKGGGGLLSESRSDE